jgi:hypothetical protein
VVQPGAMVSFVSAGALLLYLFYNCFANHKSIIACLTSNPSVLGESAGFFKLTCMLLWAVCY